MFGNGNNSITRDLGVLFNSGITAGLTDAQLLDRFIERREEVVFEAIVRRHGPMVWGLCRRVLRDHHDAEDAFQATFLVLARRAASVRPREKLGNWLYGVAFKTATKARAMRAKRREREDRVSAIPEPVAMPGDCGDVMSETLDQELRRLPEKYRTPIVLCELEGIPLKEAANQLGWPIGTVSSRLSRARSMLAKRLTRRGLSFSAGSLAVLLAQESASACPSTKLIHSTAQAACLYAASGAFSAGMVSAEVIALTVEVLKVMLLGKFKVAIAMVLGCVVIVAGTTRLAQVAAADDPAKKLDDPTKAGRLALTQKAEADRVTPGIKFDSKRRDPISERQTVAIAEKLDRPVAVHFAKGVTLGKFLEFIRVQTKSAEMPEGIPIYVDPVGLQEAEKTLESPITIDVDTIPLRACIKLALRQLGLEYRVKDGFLSINYQDSEGGDSPILVLQEKAERGELTPEETAELIRMLETRIKVKRMLVELEKLEAENRKLLSTGLQ